MISTDEEKNKKRRQRIKVVVKMFIVMGLSWIADVVSSIIISTIGNVEKFQNKGLLYSELICDCINASMVTCFSKKYLSNYYVYL